MRTRLSVRLLELFLSRKAGARAISRMFRHIRPIETAIYGTDFAIHGMSPHKKTPLFLPYSGKKRYFRPKRYAASDVGVSLSAVRVFCAFACREANARKYRILRVKNGRRTSLRTFTDRRVPPGRIFF